MRPKHSILAITLTSCLLFGGTSVLSGQSNAAVADSAVSIGFQTSGGAVVAAGVGISFQSGGINITTNEPAATFIITGATTFTGSGTSASFPNAPPGQYTIAFGDLVGYVTPNTQTQNLAVGGTITFSGTYISVQPTLGASPTILTFTYQQGTAGPPAPQYVVVSSSGASLSFNAHASSTPPNGTWLTVYPTAGTTGSPNGTLAVSVAGGLTAGTYNGHVTLTAAGASNSPLSVPVTLTVSATGSPAVEFTPPYLVFPTSGGNSSIMMANSGTAPLTVTLPQVLTGFNSFDFAIATGTTCINGDTVAPGSSCVIKIAFNPVTTSAESAAMSVLDNASNSPQTIPLSGGAALASLIPNPVPGSNAAQVITLVGSDFAAGAIINWQDLTHGTSGTVTPLSITPNEITASMLFNNVTAAWQIQVANPSGSPSNWFSFEVLGSQYAYISDDYPFQNATIDATDPYDFPFRECTSFVAWRMNRDAGTTNPRHPYFVAKMGGLKWSNASNWNTIAKDLGYAVDQNADVGAIAQWGNGKCGGKCADGHVAYVEQVNGSNGSIVVSEYNYPETSTLNHDFNIRTISATAKYPPTNFIHIVSLRLGVNLLNFGSQPVGIPTELQVTMTNPTNVPIPVTGITVSGTNPKDFATTNSCGSSVAPGGTCQVTVTFIPMGQGARSALITVQDTAAIPIKQRITLTGAGI